MGSGRVLRRTTMAAAWEAKAFATEIEIARAPEDAMKASFQWMFHDCNCLNTVA